MDSQIRRVINKNNTELIAAEAKCGVIALRIDVLIAFANRVHRSPSRAPVSLIALTIAINSDKCHRRPGIDRGVAKSLFQPGVNIYGCKARSGGIANIFA